MHYDSRRQEIVRHADSLVELRKNDPPVAKVVDAYVAREGIREADVLFLALRARRAWVGVLIDRKSAEPLRMFVTEKI